MLCWLRFRNASGRTSHARMRKQNPRIVVKYANHSASCVLAKKQIATNARSLTASLFVNANVRDLDALCKGRFSIEIVQQSITR